MPTIFGRTFAVMCESKAEARDTIFKKFSKGNPRGQYLYERWVLAVAGRGNFPYFEDGGALLLLFAPVTLTWELEGDKAKMLSWLEELMES